MLPQERPTGLLWPWAGGRLNPYSRLSLELCSGEGRSGAAVVQEANPTFRKAPAFAGALFRSGSIGLD